MTDYRARRRLAIFVMAVVSMVVNPGGDVGSMLLMFVPLVILYEFGILLCDFWKRQDPFEEALPELRRISRRSAAETAAT